MSPDQSAEKVREQSYLFRTYVTLSSHDQTEWFHQPAEGCLLHVEWDREVAVLTWMVTRYPELNDGEVSA